MPSPSNSAPFRRKKSLENKESRETDEKKVEKTSETVTAENNEAQNQLVQSKEKIEKKSKWKWGLGTTTVRENENPINSISATGIKLTHESGDFEMTAGASNTSEQVKPGEKPTNTSGIGFGIKFKF